MIDILYDDSERFAINTYYFQYFTVMSIYTVA